MTDAVLILLIFVNGALVGYIMQALARMAEIKSDILYLKSAVQLNQGRLLDSENLLKDHKATVEKYVSQKINPFEDRLGYLEMSLRGFKK